MTPSQRQPGFSMVVAMLAMVAAPAGVALGTVHPGVDPHGPLRTVHGYTWSLLFFVVPIVAIGFWLLPHEHLKFPRRAFFTTLLFLGLGGCLMEFVFARRFFTFPNPEATLPIRIPALGGWVPSEEYAFYLTGFAAILILYLWLGEYWLAAYNAPDYPGEAQKIPRLLRLHPGALGLGVFFIALGIVYKKALSPHKEGFPGYFTVLVLIGLVPATSFFHVTKPFINWRALSVTLFYILLVSLLWETTLAIPNGWWNYHPDQMLGIFILGWGGLPIEAVMVWVSVTFATAILFEVVKLWHASGRRLGAAFLG